LVSSEISSSEPAPQTMRDASRPKRRAIAARSSTAPPSG
jgi:hypothetical protein